MFEDTNSVFISVLMADQTFIPDEEGLIFFVPSRLIWNLIKEN